MSEEHGNLTPTGKRQRTGASTVTAATYESKQVATTSRDDDNPGGGVMSFLPEVASEMKKVIWPTASQMVTYTLVVFAFLIVLTALVFGVDFLAGIGVEKLLVTK